MNTDPDQLVRRLWRLRERLSAPVSSIPYETSGSAWGTLCMQCGHKGHFTADAGVERCSRCGAQWPIVDGMMPKSGKHRGSGNRMEASYAELAVCVSILAHVPQPAQCLYQYHLDPNGGGARYAISAARALGVLTGSISESTFWTQVRIGREVVGLALERMRLRQLAQGRDAA